jgi:hypothetical protein
MSDTKQQDADESIPLDADGDVRLPVVDVLTGCQPLIDYDVMCSSLLTT